MPVPPRKLKDQVEADQADSPAPSARPAGLPMNAGGGTSYGGSARAIDRVISFTVNMRCFVLPIMVVPAISGARVSNGLR